ncbi:MAG: LAGLIDADG family homing endonuclease [Candidatus Omnitrophota bacterium]
MNPGIYQKWSPELAYAIGLITTDGSISKDRRHINFTTSDLQLAKLFKKILSLPNKIGKKASSSGAEKKYYFIQFGDVKFYNWLKTIGLTNNKTYRLGKLKIPQKYFRDFLRGHLDGDGSIVTYKDNYLSYKNKRYLYNRLYLTFHSSSLKHILWVRKVIKSLFYFQGSLSGWKAINRKVTLWKLRFAKNDSLKVLAWLYYKPNLACLLRKRKIALRYIQ